MTGEPGRPTLYCDDLANEFCARVAQGRSVRSVTSDDDMPTYQSIYKWLHLYPDFFNKYLMAKYDSADADADKIESIAEKVLDGEYDANAARVAIDAYKWTTARKQPKKYGDFKMIDSNIRVSDVTNLSDDELEKIASGE